MSSRPVLVCAVIAGLVDPGPLWAQETHHKAPPARGMALTTPWHGMAFTDRPQPADVPQPPRDPIINAVHTVNLPPTHKRMRFSGGDERLVNGRLPNQRTGPKRDHVVRDICIGC
jgi:hypothetical protein